MIVLDTNVISEVRKLDASEAVAQWLDAQEPTTLCLTSVNLAELLAGVAVLAEGRRKAELRAAVLALIERLFGSRVLSLDAQAASIYGDLVGRCYRVGRPLPLADGLIAAIALAHGCAVATRDVAPFAAAGVEVIDPWAYTA